MSESFEITLQELYRIKWYETFFHLLVACLSLADPITDIFTLMGFYRADHVTWFSVGLVFVVLPCLFYPLSHYFSAESVAKRNMDAALSLNTLKSVKTKHLRVLFRLHPFAPFLTKLQTFWMCFQHYDDIWKRSSQYHKTELPTRPEWATEKTDALLLQNKIDTLFEALLESAPQILIQLFAIGVQEEPVQNIQMISLPLSFLSLSLSFSTLDKMLHDDEIGVLDLKHDVLLFVTELLILIGRLFAIAFFIVSYKWWVCIVIFLHAIILMVIDILYCYQTGNLKREAALVAPCFSLLNWLRDDMSLGLYVDASASANRNTRKHLINMQNLCNILFVLENLSMISLFFLKERFHNWYSLPLLICVSLFSYLGATLRYFHLRDLRRNYEPYTTNEVRSAQQAGQFQTVTFV